MRISGNTDEPPGTYKTLITKGDSEDPSEIKEPKLASQALDEGFGSLHPLQHFAHSVTIMSDGCVNFRKFLVEGTKPNLKKTNEYIERSLMLVTALAPVIGYDKASKIAHHAMDNDLTLKAAALQLGCSAA